MLTLGIGWEIEAILQTCKVGPHFQSLEKSVLNAPILTGTLKLDSILPTIRCGQLADSNQIGHPFRLDLVSERLAYSDTSL